MAEADKLINIHLYIRDKTEDISPIKGFKLYLFETLYLIQKYQGKYKYLDVLFVIVEFIQLMAFFVDKIYDENSGNYILKIFVNFFRFSQFIFLWKNTTFYFITYIIASLYIIIFLLLFCYVFINSISSPSQKIIKVLAVMFQFQTILNIPFLRILFSLFFCKNNTFEISSEIKCKSGVHIFMIIHSAIIIIIYKLIIIIFHLTLYEFGVHPNRLKSGYSSSTEVLLDFTKIILIIIYQIISYEKVLAVITLLISLTILIHFLIIKPYSNVFSMKLYFSLYALFCWSSFIYFILISLKNSKFKIGIELLIFGFPLIVINIFFRNWKFFSEKYFSFYLSDSSEAYNTLLEIEKFLKLVICLDDKIKKRDFILILIYINNYEELCTDSNCYLKQFLKIPIKPENIENLKIILLQHVNVIYKKAISKYPNHIKLRISYALFLTKQLNKKLEAKNNIILLNKLDANLEQSFLIYKFKKYFNETMTSDEEINESYKNVNLSLSKEPKKINNEIKYLIENITNNYISFWNILLLQDLERIENFNKMNVHSEKIKFLNNELQQKIKFFESLNLIEQKSKKIYIEYLTEILNDIENANKYKIKINNEEQNINQYDETNLLELNYKELSKTEEYKYIVINLLKNEIINVSLSVCKIFGYTKEELIGLSLDILFPEIYHSSRKLFFKKKLKDYKRKQLIENKKIISDIWIEDSFGIDKNKFLIPIKLKWMLSSLDFENIYLLGNIYIENKKYINSREQEIVHVLTDKNLNIQNYTSNSVKILFNNSFEEIHNYNISNFIMELKENMINESIFKNEKDVNNNFKNHYTKFRRITKYTNSDLMKKYKEIIGHNSMKIISWKYHEINKGNNYLKTSIIDKKNNIESSLFSEKNINKINNNYDNRNTFPINNKSINLTCLYSKEKYQSQILKNKEEKRKSKLLKQKEKLFKLLVKEAKLNSEILGYIFIFKLYISKEKEKNGNENSSIKDLSNSNEINDSKISVSFINNSENKGNFDSFLTDLEPLNKNEDKIDINFQNIYIEKENQFSFDINNICYKQFKYITNDQYLFSEEIRDKAIKKLSNIQNLLQIVETEEEEEEEEEEFQDSSHFSSNEENTNNSLESSKIITKKQISLNNENKIIIEEIKENSIEKENICDIKKIQSSKNFINKDKIEEIAKRKEDFYHVNLNKIIFYIYNFNSGFLEIQKNYNFKKSQVVYAMDEEKKNLKTLSSKYLNNTKFMKGRKKVNINKKEEEDIINIENNNSLKLKEIYKALSSKKIEKSILNMFFISIIIVLLILGTGFSNIVIFSYLKNSTYSIFLLIQKTDNLYQNLLFEISLVREMLIINNPYYNNTLNKNKTLYNEDLSKMLYNYYKDNSLIISNLTNYFNILSKEDEESITKKNVEIYILDPNKSSKFNYQYKKYTILIYSAYRELNSALYHISKLKMEEIYQYNQDVYYFLKNGMSNLLISSERQMWTLTEKIEEKIKSGYNIMINFNILIFFACCFTIFIFAYFYKKILIKRNNYLSYLKNLDNNIIISYLKKCENFLDKLKERNEEKNLIKNNIFSDSVSEYLSDNNFITEKKNKEQKVIKSKIEKVNNNINYKKMYIYIFSLFFILFNFQIAIYIDYYQRMAIFRNVAIYEYYISMYASNFIYIFISLREYIFDKQVTFYNKTVDEYMNTTLSNYYVIFSKSSRMKDIYRVYFPESYQTFLNYLYNQKICEFINDYIKKYSGSNINCNNFFYGSSRFGFFNVLTTFIEEIRSIKDKIDNYYKIAEEKNFTYNESFFNGPNGYYEDYYKQYENNIDEYKKYNPANILRTDSHKKLLITYQYINIKVYSFLISESLNEVENVFSKYNTIDIILNAVFIIFVTLVFSCIWLPLLWYKHKSLCRIKNMIYIIPCELLINGESINNLLE